LRTRFPSHRLHILAHSQGNAISSEAISQGARFDSYILTQAAIPASSYDVDAPTHAYLAGKDTDYGPTPEWRTMGYRGIYTNFTGRIVNYYNFYDPVLDAWTADQGLVKPNTVLTPYQYDGTNGIYNPLIGSGYTVTDPHESRAFVSRSLTRPVGQVGPEAQHGVFASGIDLNARFGFKDASSADHSAQFAWPIQTTRPYYLQVIDSIAP
jgi:hypothetical protein